MYKIHGWLCSFVFAVFDNFDKARVRARSCSIISKNPCSCSFIPDSDILLKYFETFRARDPDIFHLYHDSSCGKIHDHQACFPISRAQNFLIGSFLSGFTVFGRLNWKCSKLKHMCKNSAANNIASSKFSFSKFISKEGFQIFKINNQREKLKT